MCPVFRVVRPELGDMVLSMVLHRPMRLGGVSADGGAMSVCPRCGSQLTLRVAYCRLGKALEEFCRMCSRSRVLSVQNSFGDNAVVPFTPDEAEAAVHRLHSAIGHAGERGSLAEPKRRVTYKRRARDFSDMDFETDPDTI